MKKKWGNILIFAIFLVGLITVFYPSISNFWNQHLEKKLMNNYETVVQQLEQQAALQRKWRLQGHTMRRIRITGCRMPLQKEK